MAETYADFSEPETSKTFKQRIKEIQTVHPHFHRNKNMLYMISLTRHDVTLNDRWLDLGLFTDNGVEASFLARDDKVYHHSEIADEFTVGFEFGLSYHRTVSSRNVMNIFGYISNLGGLWGALIPVFSWFTGLYGPAMFSRSIITHNFKFDSGDLGASSDKDSKKKTKVLASGASTLAKQLRSKT